MLNRRAQILLKTLIERYIDDGHPVGSRALSRYCGLQLSPATIRNVMSELEELGLVFSPHTSAGRIPTPRAYRLFVDTMLSVPAQFDDTAFPLSAADRLRPDQPQKVFAAAADVLSRLSQFVGIVLTPRCSHTFRQVEFVRLSKNRLLLIIITSEGDVQNHFMINNYDYSSSQLIEASNFVNTNYSGLSFNDIKYRLNQEISVLQSDIIHLMQEVVEISIKDSECNNLLISGERNLLEITDFFSNVERLRRMFELFDQRTGILQLLDVTNQTKGVQILIGGDSNLIPIEEMSAVTAPYAVDGKVVGTLGVIGPTRMAYERIISIVEITAKLVSSALSQA